MHAILSELAADLGSVLTGAEAARHVLDRWWSRDVADLEEILGNLEHYAADGDIRDRDERYRDMQHSELQKLISLLDRGLLDEANRITFLRPS